MMTPSEMNALEKAALEDPLLADALDGYAVTGINASADMADLNRRLAHRLEEGAKLVPIGSNKAGIPWLRFAAMLVVLLGAALMIYQFAFNKEKTPIAQQASQQEQQPASAPAIPADTSTTFNNTNTASGAVMGENDAANKETPAKNSRKDELPAAPTAEQDAAQATASAMSKEAALELKAHESMARKTLALPVPDTAGTGKEQDRTPDDALAATSAPQSYNYSRPNIFRGRITDASNNPLPFANITNASDNIGTYSDARGNFVLTSPDSVIEVQIRSLGFLHENVRLHPDSLPARIALREDRNNANAIVLSKKVSGNRSRNANMTLEEPEPADGWTNYDAYLANNLNVPETYKSKQNSGGEVELSFEVNTLGEPVNITVVRSLCETCDKEAIRLVKEGPRWKRKSINGRTNVTISF